MALTDLEWLRLLLEDRPTREVEAVTGDGSSREFSVSNPPIGSGLTVAVDSIVQTSGVDYTVQDAQTVVFASAPAQNVHIVLAYTRQLFSDDELQHYLTAAAVDWDSQVGRCYRAAVLAIDSLLLGAATALSFGAGAEEVDMPSVFDRLSRLRAQLVVSLSNEAARPIVLDPVPPMP